MYEHDYDGSLAKTGKRHLGKTRWTREEVHTPTPVQKIQYPAVHYKIFNTVHMFICLGQGGEGDQHVTSMFSLLFRMRS